MESLSQSVYKTLAYADLFDYPLKAHEVYRYLISGCAATAQETESVLAALVARGQAGQKNGLFFLPERGENCDLRNSREALTLGKLRQIKKVLGIFALIPWVKMVGLTGDLAYGNGKKESDVDLMIITSPGRLWLSRFLVFFLLEILGLKMKGPSQKTKICVNVWCDQNNLEVPPEEWDLVLASDTAHLVPLINKEGAYQKFIQKNLWLKNYFPNWSV